MNPEKNCNQDIIVRHTPPIPSWIRNFSHPGYTNVFSLLPDCPRLYGTETLFGDWDAQLLLLAKDAAPTQLIKSLAIKEGADGWRHAQRSRNDKKGWKTNEALISLTHRIPGSKLYGSALANILYDNPEMSRPLVGSRNGELHQYLLSTIQWVINSMPNLKVIGCLGADAWYLTSIAIGKPEASKNFSLLWHEGKHITGAFGGKEILATPHYHPAARFSKSVIGKNWDVLEMLLSK